VAAAYYRRYRVEVEVHEKPRMQTALLILAGLYRVLMGISWGVDWRVAVAKAQNTDTG